MKRDTWIVKEGDVRPARPDGTCFYCMIPLGQEHEAGCVIRRKSIVIRFTVELVESVPEDWNADDVDERYNQSSWCRSNLIEYLDDLRDRLRTKENTHGCLCPFVKAEFIREATDKDEVAQNFNLERD